MTPTLAGYTFSPTSNTYTSVTDNISGEDYTATLKIYTISGTVNGEGGLQGVTMSGLPGNPKTDVNGDYSGTVDHGWSGTVTPSKDGYTFSLTSSTYSSVTDNISGEDYTLPSQTWKSPPHRFPTEHMVRNTYNFFRPQVEMEPISGVWHQARCLMDCT